MNGTIGNGRDDFDLTRSATHNRPWNDGSSMNDDTARVDGIDKIDGSAKYGRDVLPKNVLYARFIRCPYGAATLVSHDLDAASAVPGVVRVTIDREEADYHGRNVGVIVGESPRALERGLHALAARWKVGKVRTGIADSDPEDPPADAVADVLAEADVVLEAVYETPVQVHASIETHGAVADHRGDEATVWVSTQGVQGAAEGLEEPLGLSRAQFEVRSDYVGGGFGSKTWGAGKEGWLAATLSRELERPVWVFVDRAEDQTDTGNRPSSRTFVRLGAKRDGTIVGGQIHSWGATGVGRGGGGVRIPSGRYRFGEGIDRKHVDVGCNAGGPRPFRAPGYVQGAFAEELALNEIATKLDIDPLDLRRRLDSSEARQRMYDEGAERIGWSRYAALPGNGAIRRGLGVGSTSWPGYVARAEAEVIIHPDGSVEARQGAQDIGQGHRTAVAVCAAEALGVPLARVRSLVGRSTQPTGPTSGGSVTLMTVAPAVEGAAERARKELLQILADREGADLAEYAIVEDRIMRGDDDVMGFADACRLVGRSVTGRFGYGRRNQRERWGEGHSDGVQFAEVEVDTETGQVRVDRVVAIQSCGRVVSRKTAESQVIGGVIQGVSYALFEQRVLDRNTGTMLNADLEWYRVLGSKDMPTIEPILWQDGATGVRALGEPPTIPTAGVIAGAVAHALGVPVRSIPLSPKHVLGLLASKGGAS